MPYLQPPDVEVLGQIADFFNGLLRGLPRGSIFDADFIQRGVNFPC